MRMTRKQGERKQEAWRAETANLRGAGQTRETGRRELTGIGLGAKPPQGRTGPTQRRGITETRTNSKGVLAARYAAGPDFNETRLLRRKVDNLKVNPEKDVATVTKKLKERGLNHIYVPALNGKDISDEKMDRAAKAEADVTKADTDGRGATNAAYETIRHLGQWELKTGSMGSEASLDTGHLIADNWFDKDQKESAYVPGNLAPQINVHNQVSWRREERDAEGKGGEQKHVEVNLQYGPDLDINLRTAVDRKMLRIADNTAHEEIEKKGLNGDAYEKITIKVPQRVTKNWAMTMTGATALAKKSDTDAVLNADKAAGMTKTKTLSADAKSKQVDYSGVVPRDLSAEENPATEFMKGRTGERATPGQRKRARALLTRSTRAKGAPKITKFINSSMQTLPDDKKLVLLEAISELNEKDISWKEYKNKLKEIIPTTWHSAYDTTVNRIEEEFSDGDQDD